MNDFVNATACLGAEMKRETVKELLGNMDNILRQIEIQVSMISDGIYRGENIAQKEPNNEPCANPPMVVIMQKQVDTAERLLQEIINIREVLW